MAIADVASRMEDGPQPGSSGDVTYRQYNDEHDLPMVMELIDRDLSEPYSIFTYRYFLHQWPHLCFLAVAGPEPGTAPSTGERAVGVVVCKMDLHRDHLRGYLAMLVVDKTFRGRRIGSTLAKMAIARMVADNAEEVVLEAEVTNSGALALYRALGFVRDKRLHRYYLNGSDAYRLKLLLPLTEEMQRQIDERTAQTQAAEAATDTGAAAGDPGGAPAIL